jgi:hypothetical protein
MNPQEIDFPTELLREWFWAFLVYSLTYIPVLLKTSLSVRDAGSIGWAAFMVWW